MVEIDSRPKYYIDELSFEYCKGLNDALDNNFRSIFTKIGKNKQLSTYLRTIKFWCSKMLSEEDVKNALDEAKLSHVKFVFKEATKKHRKSKKKARNKNLDNSEELEDDDDDFDDDEDDDEDDDDDE